MAEGPDPGQTPAKSEFIVTSAFEIRKKKKCKVIRSTDTFYHKYGGCYLVISPPAAPATPTLKELSNALDSVVDWYSLGVKLGMKAHELATIEKNYHGDNERCKLEMLNHCLESGKLTTWKAVADAVQLMGKHEVALKMRAKYCSSSIESADTAGMCPLCV